jgi:uncharacterized membrane protein
MKLLLTILLGGALGGIVGTVIFALTKSVALVYIGSFITGIIVGFSEPFGRD